MLKYVGKANPTHFHNSVEEGSFPGFRVVVKEQRHSLGHLQHSHILTTFQSLLGFLVKLLKLLQRIKSKMRKFCKDLQETMS